MRLRFAPLVSAVSASGLIVAGVLMLGATQNLSLQPGDTGTITCPTKLVAGPNQTAQRKEFTCEATTPTATPTVTPGLSVSPIPTASLTSSPSSSPSPSASPSQSGSNPCTSGQIVGYGSSTVGGTGGTVINVSTVAQLRSAVAGTGKRTVNMAPGLYDLGGTALTISKPNITIEGHGAVTKRGSVMVKASQVIIRDLKSRSGDESPVAAADVDAITINGNTALRDHIVLDHVEGIWGPDVSGTILGHVTDVTVQCSIFGEGLYHSRHPEQPHSLTYNIVSEDAAAFPERITLYGDLFTTSQSRQPRIVGAKAVDVIDSVFFNYAEGPQGNPQSLNLIGNTWKKGPAAASAGEPFVSLLWRYQPGGHGAFDSRFDARVYITGQQVIGFTPANPSGNDAAVLRSSPLVPPSASTIGAPSAYVMVAASAGALTADVTTQRLRSNLLNGTSTFYNGTGFPPPNPSWP